MTSLRPLTAVAIAGAALAGAVPAVAFNPQPDPPGMPTIAVAQTVQIGNPEIRLADVRVSLTLSVLQAPGTRVEQ